MRKPGTDLVVQAKMLLIQVLYALRQTGSEEVNAIWHTGGTMFFTMGGAASSDMQDGILDPESPSFEQEYCVPDSSRSPPCILRADML